MPRRPRPLALAALALPAVLAACAGGRSPALPPAGLDQARARWAEAGVRSYDFVYERICFCTPDARGPFAVSVRDGAVAAVRNTAVPDSAVGAHSRLRVEDLFDVLGAAYDARAHYVRVVYDRRYGYPLQFFVDGDAGIADEETGYRVLRLDPRRTGGDPAP